VTDGLDGSASREDQVDRQALAAAVNARMRERHIKQAQLARRSRISVATIRLIQKAQGTRHYGGDLLTAISRALDWPADHLLKVFYRLPQSDSIAAADIDLLLQEVMERINPYLAKIDALEANMSSAMDAIHHVNGRIDAIVDMRHPPGPDD
jgi:transcriptional regulator with XRE-family HTH domain